MKVIKVNSKRKPIAVIPARGGSKGIPFKNITPLNGKPLIAYTIEAALQSQLFSQVIVSTDSKKIKTVSSQYGADVIERPSKLANDTATTDDVISHLISNTQLIDCDVICLLQATSPLRNHSHIQECWDIFQLNNKPCYSMVLANKAPQKAYCLNENGTASPLMQGSEAFKPRQSLITCAYPNGAIYFFTVNDFNLKKRLPRSPVIPYIMDSKSSVDIDSPQDITIAELYLNE